MPTFGFSAYIKLLCLSERRQKSEINRRVNPTPGGYDYHRSFRLRANRLIVNNEPLDSVIRSTSEIVKTPERNSAVAALEKLSRWRALHPGAILPFGSATYVSPENEFKVNFVPDFGIREASGTTALHVWNNASPNLEGRFVRSALSLLPDLYKGQENEPDDFAVLSLRTSTIFRLSEGRESKDFGIRVAEVIDRLFREAWESGSGTSRRPGEDRPAPPPPGQ